MICPKCGTDIGNDDGFIVCPGCQAMLYAMDGAVQADESDVTIQNTSDSNVEKNVSLEIVNNSEFNNSDYLQSYDQPETVAMETKSTEAKGLPSFHSENMESDIVASADSVFANAVTENNIGGVSFEDVADYGNTASASGVIQYDVMISEINTPEQRKIIQESITDSRFKWNVDEVMSLVTKGRLVLKDLDPVTTHIIVQRIKDLKVEISWSQHVL